MCPGELGAGERLRCKEAKILTPNGKDASRWKRCWLCHLSFPLRSKVGTSQILPRAAPHQDLVCCPPFNLLCVNISPSPADSRPPLPASLLAGLPSPAFSWRSASQTTRALGLNVLHGCQFFQEVVYTLGSYFNQLLWSSPWKVLLLPKNIRALCCKWWVNPWPPIVKDSSQPNMAQPVSA